MNISAVLLEISSQMFLRLLAAIVVGALVGYERERAGKPAGVRTVGMVCLGAALFAVVSIYGFDGIGDLAHIAAQVVTGIGFLGAGAILHQRGSVHGLTTAARLWVTAAIGLAMVGNFLAADLLHGRRLFPVPLFFHLGPLFIR